MPPAETARIPEELSGRQRRTPVGKVTLRHTFRALRHRNYRLFFYGQLVSLIGTWMQQTAMSWLVYQITGSKFLLGVAAAPKILAAQSMRIQRTARQLKKPRLQ